MGAQDPQQMHEIFGKFFNSKDADGIMSLYEDDAVIVAAPGQPAAGKAAIREALAGFLAMNATIEFIAEAEPVISGDLALTHAKWRLTPEGGEAMEGATAEVLRRQSDGTWLYVVDNPWGTSVLDG
jgi:uncharacterized protein (TIGR02246 family)